MCVWGVAECTKMHWMHELSLWEGFQESVFNLPLYEAVGKLIQKTMNMKSLNHAFVIGFLCDLMS